MSEAMQDLSMAELFRNEIESQSTLLTKGLLALERNPLSAEELSGLMRAAHSLKGAARIVGCAAAVRIAHAMEDCFVTIQRNPPGVDTPVDALLVGVDLLARIRQLAPGEFTAWNEAHETEIAAFIASLAHNVERSCRPLSGSVTPAEVSGQTASESGAQSKVARTDRVLRVTAENLSRLLGLGGETLVASRWLDTFVADITRMRRLQREVAAGAEELQKSLPQVPQNGRANARLAEVRSRLAQCDVALRERVAQLDAFNRRFASFSTRLYQEVLDCRMRPFSDAVEGLPRFVRDLARTLGKTVKLEILGEATTVDRDILERLKAPMDHLLRNALDHGVEAQEERKRRGKPLEGTIRLEAAHSAGKLLITLADDGNGIDVGAIRETITRRNLTTVATAEKMGDGELLEFLFLPGFTLKDSVSEISGRGVGLDVVQTMVKEVGGVVRISTNPGQGTRFQLELPLTLSMVGTLLVEIAGEPYAFPLARIENALKLPAEQIHSAEGRQHFALGTQQVGLVAGSEILQLGSLPSSGDLSIVVLGEKNGRYGVAVDRFLGEQELVVRPLDPRLGKVRNISAAALLPDGSPLLIVDVDDLIREIDKFVAGSRFSLLGRDETGPATEQRKRVLVVDDSLTVRELERKLLDARGYAVDVAVDGMDGWNAVRTGQYDLVVTDIDMPRLDGVELVKLIRKDSRLKALPVMIVSYKDREEDRQRGLEAGADYYLTKGSFHDETLIRAVVDLIGETTA